jgi:hypothetical protein
VSVRALATGSRRAVVAFCTIAGAMATLTGCAPGLNSVVAIGVDGQGHLVGAVKLCNHSISRASLSPILAEGQQTTYTYWNRSQPLDHQEAWRLDVPTSGSWKLDGSLPTFTPGGVYGFTAQSSNGAYQGQFLQFTGAQLAQLSSSQFLVSTKGTDPQVIPRIELSTQPCPW